MEKEVEDQTIKILTIQTPSGEIPLAKSLKKLTEYWNEVIEGINKGRKQLNRELEEINETIGTLTQLVKSQSEKTKILIDGLRDLKVRMKALEEDLEETNKKIERERRVKEKEVALEESAREILLSDKEKGDKND